MKRILSVVLALALVLGIVSVASAADFTGAALRAFGLDAARAVLGHAGGGCVTDVYTFDALEEEMVRAAAPAVEALG